SNGRNGRALALPTSGQGAARAWVLLASPSASARTALELVADASEARAIRKGDGYKDAACICTTRMLAKECKKEMSHVET
ncbi:MAG: hypothetical protein WCO77_13635, partial [bacterium]